MHLYTPLISFNWTLLMIWATVIVLFLILKKNFFEKVHNFVANREAAVKDAFANADLVNKLADDRLEEYNKRILKSEVEAREILKKARLKAEEQSAEIVDEANRKAALIIHQAEQEIQRDKQKAMSEVRDEIVSLAILAAEKIVEKQIEKEGQGEIIDRIIDQVGTSQWQN